MQFLPTETYALIEQSVPIVCVDFVPVRRSLDGVREVGLILRESPYGRVWCHLGGRIGRGETIADALRRHARDTLGVDPELAADPQPEYVYQWFPPELRPADGVDHGRDPRKHAVGLSFVVELAPDAAPQPTGEAIEFSWHREGEWPEPLWPGCRTLLGRLLAGQDS